LYVSAVLFKCTLLQISCSLDSIVTQDVCGHPEPTSSSIHLTTWNVG
jgi:hypothetical protein